VIGVLSISKLITHDVQHVTANYNMIYRWPVIFR